MKILMGLLGYSCKIHRKRSRFSFSEDKKSSNENDTPSEENREKVSKPSGDDENAGEVAASSSRDANNDERPKTEQDQKKNSHGKKCAGIPFCKP